MPAGHRYLWPFPGPVHRRKEEHDLGSGWKPEEGHGTAAEEEGELGGTRKASTVVKANTQWWKRGGGGCSSIPARIESHVHQFSENYGRTVLVWSSKVVGEQWFEWWDVRVLPLNCQPWPNQSKTDHIFLHFWLLQRTSANWDMAKENMF